MAEKDEKIRFQRLSITMDGSTMTISQYAKNLSEAIDQELDYFEKRGKIPAQINFKEDD